MVGLPTSQFPGQTSPFSAKYQQACTNLNTSSIFLPTGSQFIEQQRRFPQGSMTQVALRATPLSSPDLIKQPQADEISWLRSDRSGNLSGPIPPFSSGVIVHCLCTKWESTEHPTSYAPIFSNSSDLALNALISVGHTNVKSSGQKNNTRYFPLKLSRVNFLNKRS